MLIEAVTGIQSRLESNRSAINFSFFWNVSQAIHNKNQEYENIRNTILEDMAQILNGKLCIWKFGIWSIKTGLTDCVNL